MLNIFDDLERGHCKRIVDHQVDSRPMVLDGAKAGDVVQLDQLPGGHVTDTQGDILLKDVAIITPCGDVVVSNLTLEVGSSFYNILHSSVVHYTKILFNSS